MSNYSKIYKVFPKIYIGLLIFLTGCAHGPTLIEHSKPVNVVDTYSVKPQLEWSQFSNSENSVWTVNGTELEAIIWISPRSEGDTLFDLGDDRAEKAPKFGLKMTAFDVEEYVVDSFTETSYVNVEAENLTPIQFSNIDDGFQFELSMINTNGLRFRGKVVAGIKDEKLYIVLFRAPELHYYGYFEPAFNRLIENVRIDTEDVESG